MTKLEKVIKKIFHKNNCHTLNITIEVLLGECDLLSQDAVIRKKWKSLFWQKEKKFKIKIQKKHTGQIFVLLNFYQCIYLCIPYIWFPFFFFFYLYINRGLNCSSHGDCLHTLVKCKLVIGQRNYLSH